MRIGVVLQHPRVLEFADRYNFGARLFLIEDDLSALPIFKQVKGRLRSGRNGDGNSDHGHKQNSVIAFVRVFGEFEHALLAPFGGLGQF